jgi:hypothetical protein
MVKIWYDANIITPLFTACHAGARFIYIQIIVSVWLLWRYRVEKKSVEQMLAEIHQLMKSVSELSETIITQAELQSYTEDLYNQLIQVAYDGIAFVLSFQVGQVITSEMLATRDELVQRAQHLILDAPNAQQ